MSPHRKCSHTLWWQAQSVCFLLQSYSLLSSLLVEMASHVSFQKCWTFISPDSLLARDSRGPVPTNEYEGNLLEVSEKCFLLDKRDIGKYSSPFMFWMIWYKDVMLGTEAVILSPWGESHVNSKDLDSWWYYWSYPGTTYLPPSV